jgi:hypothetical protein
METVSAPGKTDLSPSNRFDSLFADLIPGSASQRGSVKFIPVDHDPFASQSSIKLVPVDHNPYSSTASGPEAGNKFDAMFSDLIPTREKSLTDVLTRTVPNDVIGMAEGFGNAVNYGVGTATGGVTNALNAVLPQSMQITPQNDTERQWLQNANSFPGDVKNAAQSIKSLGDGAMASIPGVGQINDWAVQHGVAPAYDKTNETNDKQLFQRAVEPINTAGKLGNMAYEHPVQSAATVAGMLSGAGEVADAAQLTRLASMLKTGGEIANPVNAVTGPAKLAGKVASYPLAGLTGTTPEAVRIAAETGAQGGETAQAFKGNMRGTVPQTNIVDDAKGAVRNITGQRGTDYNKNMAPVKKSDATVDTGPIWQKLNALHDSLHVNPENSAPASANASAFAPLQKATPAEMKTLQGMAELLHEWEAHPQGRTPLGMDALKQRFDEFKPSITDPNAGNSRRLVTAMQNAVKGQIAQVEPAYAKAMRDYEEASNNKTELTKSLSLGPKATTASALKQLASAFKDDGLKGQHLRRLAESGAPNIRSGLAGQTMSSLLPKGKVAKAVAAGVAGSGWWNPTALAALPLASPRFVGEASHLAGRVAGSLKGLAPGPAKTAFLMALSRGNQALERPANGE